MKERKTMYDNDACHKDIAELIILRYYGELGPDESKTVDTHLRSCDACRRYAEGLRLALEAVPAYAPTQRETSRAVAGVMARINSPMRPGRAGIKRLVPALVGAGLLTLGLTFAIYKPFARVQNPPVDQVLMAKADWDAIENIDVINDLDIVVAMDNIDDIEKQP